MQQIDSIRNQVERRGIAMAESLAATSRLALATYNYIALEQSVNQFNQDPDTAYIIIHDKEGRVAAYRGRADLQGKLLEDAVSMNAIRAKDVLIQQNLMGPNHTPVLDIAIPVFIVGSEHPWGTVRVGLSLEPMYIEIRQTRFIIAAIGLVALLFAICISSLVARRITRPLGHLVQATISAAQGNLSQDIRINTADEVEVLASNFSVMIREVLSQRQQLEQQLLEIKRLQRYTEKLLTTMNDGLLSIDLNGNIATINPAASNMLNIPSGKGKGYPASVVLSHVPALLDYIKEAAQDMLPSTQGELAINAGDDPRTILASYSMLLDEAGRGLEIITNLHDITDMKKLESRMRQTERLAALGTLAAGMAHEIRNPLSAIKTFVQLLPRKIGKPEFLEKFQRTVPRELERINSLIEDLLELARDPKYRFGPTDIAVVLGEVIDLFGEEMRLRQIECSVEILPELPKVWADSEQLMRAVQNLVKNAIQAMPSGGRLSIKATWKAESYSEKQVLLNQYGWGAITFRDTGNGIAADTIKHIFNPFFTTKDTGTGLGLAITHKVITEHRGHIDVESQAGEGTSFTIVLPAIRDSERAASSDA